MTREFFADARRFAGVTKVGPSLPRGLWSLLAGGRVLGGRGGGAGKRASDSVLLSTMIAGIDGGSIRIGHTRGPAIYVGAATM